MIIEVYIGLFIKEIPINTHTVQGSIKSATIKSFDLPTSHI